MSAPETSSEAVSVSEGSHFSPAVRLCEVARPGGDGSCGFHLSRTKWDPYPWVSVVEEGSAAQRAGLQVGDCLLEVNGEDVVGQKIAEVADRVRARPDCASLLVWNCGADEACDPESLCCGPMPVSLKRLSSCLGAVLGSLECPVCLDTIPPPAHQCGNGHLMCAGCRARAERCPVCRVRLCRGRSLLADQVYAALTDAFNVSAAPSEERSAKLRQKLLVPGGASVKQHKKRAQQPPPPPELKVSFTPSNKFLTKLMGKSSSLTNLAITDDEPVRLSAVPRHLSITAELAPQLKVKSLSTSEINRPLDGPGAGCGRSVSPSPPSRSPSPQGLGPRGSRLGSGLLDAGFIPLGSSQRPSSCHSSLESLTEPAQPELLYRCPWWSSCALRLPAARLVSHGRAHAGPLLLAFKPHCDLALPLPGPLCVQLPDPRPARAGQPRELFVDVHRGRLRAWLAGSPEDCRCWRLRVRVFPAPCGREREPDDAELEAEPEQAATLLVRSLSVDSADLRRGAAAPEADVEVFPLPVGAARLALDFVGVDPNADPFADSLRGAGLDLEAKHSVPAIGAIVHGAAEATEALRPTVYSPLVFTNNMASSNRGIQIGSAWFQRKINLRPQHRGVHLVTEEILRQMPEIGQFSVGLFHVQILHTSASLALNESWDPDVRDDMEMMLNKIVPEGLPYRHSCEGPDDMPAHVKACFLGSSLSIPISEGKLNVGTWQGIWLCEHRDHAGSRKVVVTINGCLRDSRSRSPLSPVSPMASTSS
ncbi:UPF0047 protein YjbQ [Frankliniella fusca]|nr:UPF0047 protein YjbQ [Frankliniella fusca]